MASTKTVRIHDEVMNEVELFFNPSRIKYVDTNLVQFVSDAVKEKLDRIKQDTSFVVPIKKKSVGK